MQRQFPCCCRHSYGNRQGNYSRRVAPLCVIWMLKLFIVVFLKCVSFECALGEEKGGGEKKNNHHHGCDTQHLTSSCMAGVAVSGFDTLSTFQTRSNYQSSDRNRMLNDLVTPWYGEQKQLLYLEMLFGETREPPPPPHTFLPIRAKLWVVKLWHVLDPYLH